MQSGMCAKEGGRLCRTVFNGGVGSRDALGYSGQVEPGRGMKGEFLDGICSSEKQEEDIKWRNRDRQLEKKREMGKGPRLWQLPQVALPLPPTTHPEPLMRCCINPGGPPHQHCGPAPGL